MLELEAGISETATLLGLAKPGQALSMQIRPMSRCPSATLPLRLVVIRDKVRLKLKSDMDPLRVLILSCPPSKAPRGQLVRRLRGVDNVDP